MHRMMTFQRASQASPVAIVSLVVANMVPLAGVVFLGWDLMTLLVLYWVENAVVGVFAVGRILTAAGPEPVGQRSTGQRSTPQPPPPPPPSQGTPLLTGMTARIVLTAFFCFHYGFFWLIHGVFVLFALPALFTTGDGMTPAPDPSVVLVAVAFLLVSHALSFWLNWLRGGEFRTSSARREMGAPYTRVAVLHLTIIFGAIGTAILGVPVWALIVMVVVKTAIDLRAHLAERRRAAVRAEVSGMRPVGT